jgi:hypothetical protein
MPEFFARQGDDAFLFGWSSLTAKPKRQARILQADSPRYLAQGDVIKSDKLT